MKILGYLIVRTTDEGRVLASWDHTVHVRLDEALDSVARASRNFRVVAVVLHEPSTFGLDPDTLAGYVVLVWNDRPRLDWGHEAYKNLPNAMAGLRAANRQHALTAVGGPYFLGELREIASEPGRTGGVGR